MFHRAIRKNNSATFSWTTVYISSYHRLNVSSSPVLTATSFSYGEAKNSTPHRIKTPEPIEIKFGAVDYVGKGTRHAKGDIIQQHIDTVNVMRAI